MRTGTPHTLPWLTPIYVYKFSFECINEEKKKISYDSHYVPKICSCSVSFFVHSFVSSVQPLLTDF